MFTYIFQMWNSFVESSEEEQRKILNYRGLHIIKEEDEGSDTKTAEDNWVMILDERSGNTFVGTRFVFV